MLQKGITTWSAVIGFNELVSVSNVLQLQIPNNRRKSLTKSFAGSFCVSETASYFFFFLCKIKACQLLFLGRCVLLLKRICHIVAQNMSLSELSFKSYLIWKIHNWPSRHWSWKVKVILYNCYFNRCEAGLNTVWNMDIEMLLKHQLHGT